MSLLCKVHAGEFGGGIEVLILDFLLGQIHAGGSANVGKTVPFIHAKLANTNLDIQTVVVLRVDTPFGEVFGEHVFVSEFAALNLANQLPPRLGELTHGPADEVLVPEMLLVVRAAGSLSRADADKDTDFSARPFVAHGFVEDLRRRVVFAGSLVEKDGLADLDGLEGEGGGACGAASLPDGAVEFGSGFFARVIGTEEGCGVGAVLRGALVHGGHGAAMDGLARVKTQR